MDLRHQRDSLFLSAAAGVSLLLSACATGESPRLQQAANAVQVAEADPVVRGFAPVELDRAQEALARARNASGSEADHIASLAEQRAEIATERAAARHNTAQVQELGQRRDQVALRAEQQRTALERAKNQRLREQLAEMEATETERGLVLTLGDVLFEVDKATLRPGAERQLRRVAEALRNEPSRQVRVEGHTDSTGPDDYNRELSRERAEAVKQALTAAGIEPSRIVAQGFGEQYPVASNATNAGRQQNRRVDLVIMDSGVAQRSAN